MSDMTWPTHEWNDPDNDGHNCADCETVSPWKCDKAAHNIGMTLAAERLLYAIEHPEDWDGQS